MKYKSILIVGLMVLLVVAGCSSSKEPQQKDSLLVYCGAGIKKPMEEIAQKFESEYGVKVNFQFNGAGALLNQIKMSKSGDLYMPGDVYFVKQLAEIKLDSGKDFLHTDKAVAYHTPVLVTPKSNPAEIEEFEDIARSDVELALGKQSMIGRLSTKIFKQAGIDEAKLNVVTRFGTVNQITNAVKLAEADAGIIWHANYYANRDKLQLIEIPKQFNQVVNLNLAVLECSDNLELAEEFMNYVVAEKGQQIFTNYGYYLAN
ncbi:MAG: molybdate ABC transporter substrate-binding protein [Bacillota bacterium]